MKQISVQQIQSLKEHLILFDYLELLNKQIEVSEVIPKWKVYQAAVRSSYSTPDGFTAATLHLSRSKRIKCQIK